VEHFTKDQKIVNEFGTEVRTNNLGVPWKGNHLRKLGGGGPRQRERKTRHMVLI
jgi:hypothetical protein